MRELKVVGLDVDGKRIICEGADSGEKFILRADDRLRAAVRGDRIRRQPTPTRRRGPKRAEPQGDSGQDSRGRIRRAGRGGGRRRHRAGRAVRPPGAAGTLARRRAGNRLAPGARRRPRGAHAARDRHDRAGVARPRPRVARAGTPGATRTAAGPCSWRGRPAGPTTSRTSASRPARTAARRRRSTTPPAELIDPNFDTAPLRPVAPVPQLATRQQPAQPPAQYAEPDRRRARSRPAARQPARPARARKRKPEVPAWEDVLLGVRSGSQP